MSASLLRGHSAMIRVAGALEKSTEVMTAMSKAIKLPEMHKTMMEMSRGESVDVLPVCPTSMLWPLNLSDKQLTRPVCGSKLYSVVSMFLQRYK